MEKVFEEEAPIIMSLFVPKEVVKNIHYGIISVDLIEKNFLPLYEA